eukprot:CAMPEP_0171832254 /NCGR_PEP_ID=MMETSP0992-20121227/9220_1 /TAXON_ID=483369 /ORGANISM="non described non described, Strain CCMP2098" /LENGTH=46 /DNA_ID= /DNA_START= /DNA_END= /DNA_ORIENTATION=
MPRSWAVAQDSLRPQPMTFTTAGLCGLLLKPALSSSSKGSASLLSA